MFKRIFGSKNVVDTMLKGAYNGIDKSVLTAEEQLDTHKEFLKLYEPFKLVQRFLAMVYCVPYMLCWFITFVASFSIDTTDQEVLLAGTVGEIAITIAMFFFGGGAVEGVVRSIMTRGKGSGKEK